MTSTSTSFELLQNSKILLVNQSVDSLFNGLARAICEKLQSGEVVLLTGSFEEDGNAYVYKVVRSCELVRSPAWRRGVSWAAFTIRFLVHAILRRYDLLIVTTNPPLVPWVLGLMHWLVRSPYVLIEYDVYPDVLARMRVIRETGRVYRGLRWFNALAMQRAAAVVTLGYDMALRLQAHCEELVPEIVVVPNWADTEKFRPVAKNENPVAVAERLDEKFVVMYSGSFGATHDLRTLLEAAAALVDEPTFELVLVGKGTRLYEIENELALRRPPNVRLLPWQPVEKLPYSLAMADVHLVTLDAPYAGISFPSKFHTALAVGAAIIAVAPIETDLAHTVRGEHVGQVVRPRDPQGLADAIRKLMGNQEETEAMKLRSRQLAERRYDVRMGTDRYLEITGKVLARRRGTGLAGG